MKLISGTDISKVIKQELFDRVTEFKNNYNFAPSLSVILVGEDPASSVYVRTKQREAEKIGMLSTIIRLNSNITQDELIKHIYRLNNDSDTHGILVQWAI